MLRTLSAAPHVCVFPGRSAAVVCVLSCLPLFATLGGGGGGHRALSLPLAMYLLQRPCWGLSYVHIFFYTRQKGAPNLNGRDEIVFLFGDDRGGRTLTFAFGFVSPQKSYLGSLASKQRIFC